MKKTWKNIMGKITVASAVGTLALAPTVTQAAGTAPSTYVNKISDSLFGEILKVAPKIALVVIGFACLMYFIVGDEHKKSKYKGTAFVAVIAYAILLVLKPLMGWLDGLI